MDDFNLFRFATNELSHSAFWAWVFHTTNAERDALQGPKGVGESTIRFLDTPIPNEHVEVHTDVDLSTDPPPDLQIDYSDGHALYIAIKKDARFSKAQIEQYQAAAGHDDRVALLSTQFDAKDAKDICPYAGVNDIREILWPYRDSHPVVADYADWIETRKEERERIKRNAFSDDPTEVAAALSTLFGQRTVMEAFTQDMDGGWMTQHQTGDPHTEFWIAEATADQDTLFYRIDEYAPGYCLSLKQYLEGKDHPAWDEKEQRLDALRTWWTEAANETDHQLTFRDPHNQGKKTREVGCLLFPDNSPAQIIDELPQVHAAFAHKLEQNGWELG